VREQLNQLPLISAPTHPPAKRRNDTRYASARQPVRMVRVLTYEQGDSDALIPALITVPCMNTFMPEVCFMPAKDRQRIILRIY
jgi:hypothetical protein